VTSTKYKALSGRAWIVAIAATVFVWVGQAPWFGVLNNPNENVRIYMTRAIVEHGTFAIDRIIEEWGYVNDKATFDGKMYAGKGPGVSYIGVPAYWVHFRVNEILERTPSRQEITLVCRFGGTIPLTLLFLLAFARFTHRAPAADADRLAVFVALALGSTVLTYGGIFASHSLVAACLFGAHMCFTEERDAHPRPALLFAGGFLLMTAVSLEYPGALGAAVVGLLALARSRRRAQLVAWSAAGMAIPLALIMLYHWRAFGGPFENPYSHLENPEFVQHVSGGFFGLDTLSGTAFHGSYFAPGNGLFWFLPWTLVPVVGLVFARWIPRLRPAALETALMVIVYSVFITMVENWRGGWTAGPRYIVPVVPFLAWYALQLLGALRETRGGTPVLALMLGLVAVSQLNCGISAAVFPHYPEVVTNPIREVGVYFLERGYTVRGIASAMGMSGIWSWIPLALAHGAALAAVLHAAVDHAPVQRAVRTSVLAFTVGAVFVVAQARPTTENTAALQDIRRVIAVVWSPLSETERVIEQDRRLPPELRDGAAAPVILRAAARAAATRGLEQTAASLYERATRPSDEATLR
jgi:hypothetical protein